MCAPLDAKLQPLVRANTARTSSIRLLASPLFRPQSRRCLQLGHRKRCAPSRERAVLQLTIAQKGDASTVQSNPTPHGPPLQHLGLGYRLSLHNLAPRLTRTYHSAPSLVQSLLPWSA